jgi:hypothetical protein
MMGKMGQAHLGWQSLAEILSNCRHKSWGKAHSTLWRHKKAAGITGGDPVSK